MSRRLLFLMVAMSLFLLSQGNSVYAQSPQTLEVGPHIGGTTYAGDLNVWRNLGEWDWKSLNQFSYGFGGLVRFNYDSRWSFRLDYTRLHLRAGDAEAAWRPQGNLNFKSTVDDIGLMVEFNFLDYYTGKMGKSISPYIFAGISGMMYYVQPYTGVDSLDVLYFNNLGENAKGADAFTVDTVLNGRNFALSVPFGIGVKVSISNHLAATAEWRMHYAFTDYLDGVHGTYAESHAVANDYDFTDPTGSFPKGYQRGNARTNDWFGMFNLSLTWKFVIPDKAACKMTDN